MAVSRGFHQDLLSTLEVGTKGEESLQWVFCRRAEDDIGDWIWRNGGRMKILR